jgi:hypothetical protein
MEQLIPPYSPVSYIDLINRLDDSFEYQFEGEIYKPTSRVQRSGRIYTTMTSPTKKLNFQSTKSKDRGNFTWKGLPLESYDISASQLRVALALRGGTLPTSSSPWDTLNVEHSANDLLTNEMARELKKTVGLLLVRGENRIDYKRVWLEKIEAPIEDMPNLAGYKNAVELALLDDFPLLNSRLLKIKTTPDGYEITHRSKAFKRHDIQSRPLGIKTSFRRYESEPPTESNILEAIEAYVLRQAIRALPVDSPVLTCHDQIYILKSDVPKIISSFDISFKELGMLNS